MLAIEHRPSLYHQNNENTQLHVEQRCKYMNIKEKEL